MKIRICYLGLHQWLYNFIGTTLYRNCKKCGKFQSAVYDMYWEETVWV